MHIKNLITFNGRDKHIHVERVPPHRIDSNSNVKSCDIPSKSFSNGLALRRSRAERGLIGDPCVDTTKNPFARKPRTQSNELENLRQKIVDQHEHNNENGLLPDRVHKRGDKKDLHANECDTREKRDRGDRRRSQSRSRNRKIKHASRKSRPRSRSRRKHSSGDQQHRSKEKRKRSREKRDRSKDKRDRSKDKRKQSPHQSYDYHDHPNKHRNEGKRSRDIASGTPSDKRSSKRNRIDINDNMSKEMVNADYEASKHNVNHATQCTETIVITQSTDISTNVDVKATPTTPTHIKSEHVKSECVLEQLPVKDETDANDNMEEGEIQSPIKSVNIIKNDAPKLEKLKNEMIAPSQIDFKSEYGQSVLDPNDPNHHECLYYNIDIPDTPLKDKLSVKHAINTNDEDALWNDAMAIDSPDKKMKNESKSENCSETKEFRKSDVKREVKQEYKPPKKEAKSPKRRRNEMVAESNAKDYSNIYDDLQISFTPEKATRFAKDIPYENGVHDNLSKILQRSPMPTLVENISSNGSVEEERTPSDTPTSSQETDNKIHEMIPSINEISPIAYPEPEHKESTSPPDPIDLYCSSEPDLHPKPLDAPKHEINTVDYPTQTNISNEPKQDCSNASKGSNLSDTIANTVNVSTSSTDYQIQVDVNDVMTITLQRRRHKKIKKK